jgi:hypothetical protein
MSARRVALSLVVCVLFAGPASAQNWSFDARKVGLGSPGGGGNLASAMIDEARDYRAIVLPTGLFQVFGDFKKLNPSNDEFDLIRTMEYAAAPLHYAFGRNSTDSGQLFVTDIRNARLNTDLNYYRGFVPANQPRSEGLASPNWGYTFKMKKVGSGFQGIYLGAGPYLAMQTDVLIDQQLIDILGAASPVYIPNTQIRLGNTTRGQMALAITGGYRGRFPLASATSDRDGIYVAANYNFLRGFGYEDVNLALRLDTNPAGLLTVNRLLPAPLLVTRSAASSGTGRALDFGVGAVVNRWEVGFGINGVANRINWTGVERTTYALGNPFLGDSDFVESTAVSIVDARVELPVNYRGNVGYDAVEWSVVAEVGKGFGGTSFHGGYERRIGEVELRGGAMYTRELWNPSGGIGFHLSPRIALDLAVYGNSANVERKRHPAIAASIRFIR